MPESTGKSIFKLAGLNGGGAIVAVCQTVVIARTFGTGVEVEAFFAATALQMLLVKLSQSGQMLDFFIPVYNELKNEGGRERAQRALSVVLNLLAVLSLIIVAVFIFFREEMFHVIAPGFDDEGRMFASQLFVWIAPLLALSVIHQTISSIANAEKVFGYPEAATVVGRCLALMTILIFAESLGVYALVLSLFASMLCDIVASVCLCVKMGYKHAFRLKDDSVSIRFLASGFFYSSHYSGAVQLRAIALNAALTLLPQGAYAIFQYCDRLVARSSSLILRPISVVFFSHFSSAWAEGGQDFKALIRNTFEQALVIVIPVLLLAVVVGRDVLAVLWGGEAFDLTSINVAGLLFPCLLGCLLINVLSLVYRKIVTSLGHYAQLLRMLTFGQLISAGFTYLSILQFGLLGALAAQVFTASSQAVGGYLVLRKYNPDFAMIYKQSDLCRWCIAVGLAFGVSVVLSNIVNLPLGDLSEKKFFLLSGLMNAVVAMSVLVLFGLCIRVPGLSVLLRGGLARLKFTNFV